MYALSGLDVRKKEDCSTIWERIVVKKTSCRSNGSGQESQTWKQKVVALFSDLHDLYSTITICISSNTQKQKIDRLVLLVRSESWMAVGTVPLAIYVLNYCQYNWIQRGHKHQTEWHIRVTCNSHQCCWRSHCPSSFFHSIASMVLPFHSVQGS